MITCSECIEGLLPDDPRIRSGEYGLCGCDYCDKPNYFRELESMMLEETLPIIPPEHKLYNELQQTKGLLLKLQRDVNEHIDKKENTLTNYIYSTIKEETSE